MPAEFITVRLTERSLARADGLRHLLRSRVGRLSAEQLAAFAFRNDERDFARALLAARPQLWIFRTHQRAFCGDFVVIDMSQPDPATRAAWCIDLKSGERVRRGGGGAGVSFARVEVAVREIAAHTGALAEQRSIERISGGSAHVLADVFGIAAP